MSQPFIVDFIVVGAQKCGTSTLFELLQSHPALVGCRNKEPHFFSKSPDWRTHLGTYESLFPEAEGKLRFEASTTYTFFPHFNHAVWDDIYSFNPQMKIIYIVRDPVERIVSGYMHCYERGYTERSFDDDVFTEPSYLDVTRYATQITPYIRRFGRENVHICFFEDLLSCPEQLLRDVACFLKIEPDAYGDVSHTHANRTIGGNKSHVRFDRLTLPQRIVKRLAPPLWRKLTDNSSRSFQAKPAVSSAQRQGFLHLLRAEIDEIESLTGRDLTAWRSGGLSFDDSPISDRQSTVQTP